MLAPTDQAAQQDSNAERNRKQKERGAERSRARKAAAARVTELEELKEQGRLTEEQGVELAELQPKVAQWQKQKEGVVEWHRARKAEADRVAVLEELAERGPLTVEQEAELAELQPKVAQRKEKRKEKDAKRSRAGKAVADRVAVLEALAEQGPLTVEQEAELAELQPKVAQQKQKKKEKDAKRSRAGKAAADRVAVLEALAEQGPLTVEQEAELAELQSKVAQQKQKQKERSAKNYQVRKAAADRVVELEALVELGPLTVEQEAELAELQPKVAQQKQKKKERAAKYRRAGKTAIARVVELEALAEQGPLTVEQEAELAELQPKAQRKQKQKEREAKYDRAGKTAIARVVELEALAEQWPLTVEQKAELAELRPKAQQKAQRKQKQKEREAKYRREGKAAAARVVELEELAERGPLTEEQEPELAELRSKAQQWQKKKERDVERYRARRAAARVVELEELAERGPLTEEQEAELAELRPKVVGRDKEVREMTELGVGGAQVADRGVGPEGVSGWAGADQVDWDGWSADRRIWMRGSGAG